MILKEWRCAAHGEFEGPDQLCPEGCPASFVKQEIRTPPAIGTQGVKFVDQQMRGLAQDFGLTNIKNDKDGSSVMETIRKGEQFAPTTMEIPHADPGWSSRKEPPKTFSPQATINGASGNELMKAQPKLPKLKPAFVNQPNPQPGAFT